MKTILVTGAQGLVGSHLVPLLAKQHRVVAVGRSAMPAADNVHPLAIDLSEPLDPTLLPDRIDAMVYLAQSRRFRSFPDGAADMLRVNVEQPIALIEAARQRGATHFVYASTGSVYAPSPRPLREDDPTPANGFYAGSKLSAELLLKPFGALMNVALLRYFFIYGAGQQRDMLLPRLVDNVREGRTITLAGEEGIRLQPLHASDAAQAVVDALAVDGTHAINVAGPEVLSLRAVCEAAGKALGIEPLFSVSPGSGGGDLIADTARMETLLRPAAMRFGEGLADIL